MQPKVHETAPGVIPQDRIRLAPERTHVGVPGQQNVAEPQIIVIRDGDGIKAIEVLCTCGQRTRLNCVF
ncbi:MAG: hypothetical protein HY040_10410 [Planctomycetes bacterium]|nr:hypothetical protein [Planctomycetota bacterium]